MAVLVFMLLALTYGKESDVNTKGKEYVERNYQVKEWEHFKNVLELLLFQPGRGMGTPWPRKAPYEFMKLVIKNVEFCSRCKNLLDNWMNSEPNMILFRAPVYFSKIPHIFLVACGSLESRFTANGPSECTEAFSKFSLQKYYEGFSSAPTLRRRASFPATHTDYRPFKPKYFPLESRQIRVTTRKNLDLHKHSYIPIIRKDSDSGSNRGYPYFHGVYSINTTHGYIPFIPKSAVGNENIASYPASRTRVPSDPYHSYAPREYALDDEDIEIGSLPSSRTRIPVDHSNHSYIPYIPFSKEALYNETGSLPSSRTRVPLDHTIHGYIPQTISDDEDFDDLIRVSNPAYRTRVPTYRNHSFIPYIPFSNETLYNETGSLPSSRTRVPLDHNDHGYVPKVIYSNEDLEAHIEVSNPAYRTRVPTDRNHSFVPYIPFSNETLYNETGSLPSSRTRVPLDHTNHGYVPKHMVYYYDLSEIRASYPASRTELLGNTSHLYVPLFESRNETLGNGTYYYGLPASRTSLYDMYDRTHGYIPVFQRKTINETASYPASRIRIPIDNTNYTYVPYVSDEDYMRRIVNNTASYPASRTGFPADPNHDFVPLFIKVNDGYHENIVFSHPASRIGVPIYSNHSYVPVVESRNNSEAELGSLPSSRTRVPLDHTNHGYVPQTVSNDEDFDDLIRVSNPAYRTRVPTDRNHSFVPYIPFSNETLYNETGSLPSSRTRVPLDHANHGYVPQTVSNDEDFDELIRVSNPAYRTRVPTDRNHSFIPYIPFSNETLYNETGSLPSSRTRIPVDHTVHGFAPVFTRVFLNTTSFLPVSRTGAPSDSNHTFVPLLVKVPEVEHAAKPASRTNAPAPGTASCNLPFTILVSLPKAGLPASRTDLLSEDHLYVPSIPERVDVGPRAAFPATHTGIKAPERWTSGAEGVNWEHYSEVLKLDEAGNPYVDTKLGRIYGFGDLSTILSQLEEKESMDGIQCIINQQ
ncbi:HxYxP motif containing repeat protein [Cryptosporidium ryanae]|uniref:HxYxP motif containing repeat protein n=1 Tax=Cryptosporidium ryanae TaxID=515981 RepID=UPI00351A9B94|nr:HxYxP motif containing repeat protein [Cryptosporidium ryanae]